MLANFRPQKDHTTLLHAWKLIIQDINPKLPKPYLILAGATQGTFLKIKHLSQKLGLSNNIRFPGGFFIQEAYITPRGEEILLAEIKVKYDEYRFFSVGVDVEYK